MKRAPHIHMTEKQFRSSKRKEFKALRKAMDDFLLGCHFIPDDSFSKFIEANHLIEKAYEELKHWWKNS